MIGPWLNRIRLGILAPLPLLSVTAGVAPNGQGQAPAAGRAVAVVTARTGANDDVRSIDFDTGWKFVLFNPAG